MVFKTISCNVMRFLRLGTYSEALFLCKLRKKGGHLCLLTTQNWFSQKRSQTELQKHILKKCPPKWMSTLTTWTG